MAVTYEGRKSQPGKRLYTVCGETEHHCNENLQVLMSFKYSIIQEYRRTFRKYVSHFQWLIMHYFKGWVKEKIQEFNVSFI